MDFVNEYAEEVDGGKVIETKHMTALSVMCSAMSLKQAGETQQGLIYQHDNSAGIRNAYRMSDEELPAAPLAGSEIEDDPFGAYLAYAPGAAVAFEWISVNGSEIRAEPVYTDDAYPRRYYALTYAPAPGSSGRYRKVYERFEDLSE